jgi:hypothetical protein
MGIFLAWPLGAWMCAQSVLIWVWISWFLPHGGLSSPSKASLDVNILREKCPCFMNPPPLHQSISDSSLVHYLSLNPYPLSSLPLIAGFTCQSSALSTSSEYLIAVPVKLLIPHQAEQGPTHPHAPLWTLQEQRIWEGKVTFYSPPASVFQLKSHIQQIPKLVSPTGISSMVVPC